MNPCVKFVGGDHNVSLLLCPEGVGNPEFGGEGGVPGFAGKCLRVLFLMASGASQRGIHPFESMLVYNLENLGGDSLLQPKVLFEV